VVRVDVEDSSMATGGLSIRIIGLFTAIILISYRPLIAIGVSTSAPGCKRTAVGKMIGSRLVRLRCSLLSHTG
jgi:hypothetical protein